MADRRCVHKRIVESDAFYGLPDSAQTLYLHLNMAADDDGFVNCAGSIASRRPRTGKADLKLLTKERFLLQFGEIYVIKHWRISNTLKNDRLKPLNYPSVAARIWVKPNRAYTDHPVDGCITLYELKTGRPLESKTESEMESNLESQPNRTEPNRIEPNRTEPAVGGFEAVWREYPEHRQGGRAGAQKDFAETIRTADELRLAQESLAAWKRSEQWTKEDGKYVPSFHKWLTEGIWQTIPRVAHQGRQLDDDEWAAIQRMLREG